MKNDQYFRHDACLSENGDVMILLQNEKAEGYGIFWMILEHLRKQNDYSTNMEILEVFDQRHNLGMDKIIRIINNYSLFYFDDNKIRSYYMDESMESLEKKRNNCSKAGLKSAAKREMAKRQSISKKYVKFNKQFNKDVLDVDTEENRIGENSKEYYCIDSSKEMHYGKPAAVADMSEDGKNWEMYVDMLQHEQVWIEATAINSGLKQRYIELFPHVIEFFKKHVKCSGKENSISSLHEAKSYLYYCSINNGPLKKRLIEYLDSFATEDPKKFEEVDSMGRRSYCGHVIPDEAPFRPHADAHWDDVRKEWRR